MWPQENHYVWNDTNPTGNGQEDVPEINGVPEDLEDQVRYVMIPLSPSVM